MILLLATCSSATVAQPTVDAERAKCLATGEWAPIRLPEAGVNLWIPCDDKQLVAYKNANETRQRTEGVVGCENKARTFNVIYAVNTPSGFFDGFLARVPESRKRQLSVSGHRVIRSSELSDGRLSGTQVIEIDPARAIIMATSSATNDADFAKITSCFFNSFTFGGQ